MTENRRRVSVSVSGQQRAANIRAPARGGASAAVPVPPRAQGKSAAVEAAGQEGRHARLAACEQGPVRSATVTISPGRSVERPAYAGPYEVDPLFTAQALPTNGMRMTDDLTVRAIYLADTANPAGGVTVYIGGEFING